MRNLILCAALAIVAACTPGVGDRDDVTQSDREVAEGIVSEFGDLDDDGIALRDALVDAGLMTFADNGDFMGQKPPPAAPVIVGSPAVDDDGDGQSENRGDCDDANTDIYRGAPEFCDGEGVDNDCDGEVSPGNDVAHDDYILGVDLDQDGVADPRTRMPGCGTTMMSRYVVPLTRLWQDCDDSTVLVRPYKAELADGIDNNCDGALLRGHQAMVDEHVGEIPCFTDSDLDGYGNTWSGWAVGPYCPLGSVQNKRDCDDSDPLRAPGRLELCNNVDDDCDSFVDNAQAPPLDQFRNRATGAYEHWWYSVCTMDRMGYDHR